MSQSSHNGGGGLSARIDKLLPRLNYRRVASERYRRDVFRLRHDAYLREGAIAARPDGLFTDEVDDSENTSVFGIEVDGELMSSIRVSVSTPDMPEIPTARVFPEQLEPEIDAGRVIVDPTRFVVDHASSRRFPELPYVTLRLGWMAMAHFEADLLLAAVRPEHVAFYRRFWSSSEAASPRLYPLLAKPVSLTVSHYATARDVVEARYPFLASTAAERALTFGEPVHARRHDLEILPDRNVPARPAPMAVSDLFL